MIDQADMLQRDRRLLRRRLFAIVSLLEPCTGWRSSVGQALLLIYYLYQGFEIKNAV